MAYVVIGKNAAPEKNNEIVTPERYLIVDDPERKLLVDFKNRTEDTLNAICFLITQKDEYGDKINVLKIRWKKLDVRGGEEFGRDVAIRLKENCAQVEIEVKYAEFGKYRHTFSDLGERVEYGVAPDHVPVKREKTETTVKVKRLKVPVGVTLASILMILFVFFSNVFYGVLFDTSKTIVLDDVKYTITYEGAKLTEYQGGNATAVNIPESVEGYPVVSIEKGAFYQCHSLYYVTIDAYAAIDNYAFQECDNLRTVTSRNVTSIGVGAFYGCKNLSEVSFINLSKVGTSAFEGCSLKNVCLMNQDQNMIVMEKNAWIGLEDLNSLVVGKVTSIGNFWEILKTPPTYLFFGDTENQWQSICYRNNFSGTTPLYYNPFYSELQPMQWGINYDGEVVVKDANGDVLKIKDFVR